MTHHHDATHGRPFIVEVNALRRVPGSHRRVEVRAPLEGLDVSGSQVPPGSDVELDALLESVSGGIVVTATVRAPWEGECRRCLEPATGIVEAEILELCVEHVDDEESYELGGDLLDLAPLARDACILALPLAPLCSADCRGLCPSCGVNLNFDTCNCGEPLNPRWAALGALLGDEATDETSG
jgi:uncharacterized protein